MDIKPYDEQDAIRFIRDHVGDEISRRCSDDDIYLLIDTLFDYYDEFDDNDDFDPTTTETAQWVTKQLSKDKECKLLADDIPELINAELKYEETLFDF